MAPVKQAIRQLIASRVRGMGQRVDRTWRAAASRFMARGDAGMSTAEYAIGTVAACAFAAVLYKVVTSGEVLGLLTGVVSRALHVPF
jgi:hypothetical protein